MKVRIGIDVRGTFTDAVAIDNETFEVVGSVKVPTTHAAAEGVAAGIDRENGAGAASDTAAAQGAGQAIAALVSLGYSQSEAARAVAGQPPEARVQELIKVGLKKLSGAR